jgi:hypothetical protein
MNWTSRLVPARFEPVRAIEWVIAICTLMGGLYVFTPLYDISQRTAPVGVIAQIIQSQYSVVIFGILLIASAVLIIIGLKLNKPRLRSSGLFILIMVRTFQIISTFVIQGFLPITWIYPLTITLVCVVLWGWARLEVHSGVT